MLLDVLDRCLSAALAARPIELPRTRAVMARPPRLGSLASYPRLKVAIEKAEADGVLKRTH